MSREFLGARVSTRAAEYDAITNGEHVGEFCLPALSRLPEQLRPRNSPRTVSIGHLERCRPVGKCRTKASSI
ncbi:hypothetical protein KP509_03G037700 [Ceratopteris richardii]|uniref:Uncharacterized protein n=1 Tax=Ceratopteris richardii TaxID=49495 RepID=A0A8T2V1X6_CERRI|nr:hypothetical protein KP509_03G037700 [Ceratopteris richardii]